MSIESTKSPSPGRVPTQCSLATTTCVCVIFDVCSITRNQIVVHVIDDPNFTESGKVHYLPHHAVVHNDKQRTKSRVVYDASDKEHGPSLNSCLYTRMKFDEQIMDIMVRFRTHRVALATDIEKAFLMVAVSPLDRDVLQFL